MVFFLKNNKGGIYITDYSEIFNTPYELDDTIRIVNTKQAGMYIKYHVPLIDLFWSKDTLVFVFDKAKSKAIYDLWCRRELI